MRVHFGYYLAPVSGPDAVSKLLLKMGFNPWFMVGDGAIRRDVAVAIGANNSWLPANSLNWEAEDKSNPEAEFNNNSIIASGRLALHPFYTPEVPPTRSIMFDFEGTWWQPTEDEITLASKQIPAVFGFQGDIFNKRICGAMSTFCWWAGVGAGNQLRTHVGAFGWPQPYMLRYPVLPNYIGNLFDNMTYAAPELYTWPDRMDDSTWFDYLQLITKDLNRLLPWLPRFAILCPFYQKRGDPMLPDRANLDGTPVPEVFWEKQLSEVIKYNYEPYIWVPYQAAITPELTRLFDIAHNFNK